MMHVCSTWPVTRTANRIHKPKRHYEAVSYTNIAPVSWRLSATPRSSPHVGFRVLIMI